MAADIPRSSIFQKILTGLDLAMFCFPESQPPLPNNCTLVSLQLLRLLTPVESTTLIPIHPQGVLLTDTQRHVSVLAGIPVTFRELSIVEARELDRWIIPGYACLMNISNNEQDFNHTVVYWKTLKEFMLLIDPQSGKIYSKNPIPGYPIITQWDEFFTRNGITRLEVLQYTDNMFTREEHSLISQKIDYKLGDNALYTFFGRGTLVRRGVYPSTWSSEVEMTAGKKSKRTRKHSSRSANLTR